jgi:hypothetical protein
VDEDEFTTFLVTQGYSEGDARDLVGQVLDDDSDLDTRR